MEAYINLALFSMLNFSQIDWSGDDILGHFPVTRVSTILSLSFGFILVILPIVLFIHYCRNVNLWANKDFIRKYGTFVSGMKQEPM